MFNDIRYGLRMLLKKPGFTAIAVLSLALGIGANTAIFSLVDAVMIKSLPVREPEKLVLFGKGQNQGAMMGFPNDSWDLFSYPFYRQAQQRTDVFSGVASLLSMTWTTHGVVNGSNDLDQMEVQLVSGSYFPVLGVNPGLGRVLTEADDQTPGAHPVAVVSHAWWEQRLGGDSSIIGKTIESSEQRRRRYMWFRRTREPNSLTDDTRSLRNNVVGQDYFAAMGIPLVQGRAFGPQDSSKSQKVAVVSESMVQRFFPGSSPLGKRFGIDGPESTEQIEVVGVVKDAKVTVLTEEFRPMAYYPHSQTPDAMSNFVVRFSGPASAVVPQVRQTIRSVNQNLPVDEVVSLSDHVGRSLVQQKLVARLASFFGLLALLLASVGLYGVMSYGVARRTNEIGIRMALGAQGRSVLWLVLRESLTLVGIGLVLGVVASLALTKTAQSLLYELKPNDPLTITLATLLLAVVALVAGYLPARRAARVDPMMALREE